MKSKVRSFFALDCSRKRMLAEAVIFLFCAKLLLLLVPFKAVVKIFRNSAGKSDKSPDTDSLSQIKWSLYNADKLSFWKNRCLVMGLAGRWMLRRRGISSVLSLGVKFDKDKKLIAHAWLNAADFEVVEKGGDYRELHRF